jgi:hypothetical protein
MTLFVAVWEVEEAAHHLTVYDQYLPHYKRQVSASSSLVLS